MFQEGFLFSFWRKVCKKHDFLYTSCRIFLFAVSYGSLKCTYRWIAPRMTTYSGDDRRSDWGLVTLWLAYYYDGIFHVAFYGRTFCDRSHSLCCTALSLFASHTHHVSWSNEAAVWFFCRHTRFTLIRTILFSDDRWFFCLYLFWKYFLTLARLGQSRSSRNALLSAAI